MTWFDLPQTSTAFTADSDATFTATNVVDYSADLLSGGSIAMSVNMAGHVGGGVAHELYFALPAGYRAPRAQRSVAFTDQAGGAYVTSEGTVVTARRTGGGEWSGDIVIAFDYVFAV